MMLNDVSVITDPHTLAAVRTYEYGMAPGWVGQYAPCYRTPVYLKPARGTGPTSAVAYPSTTPDWSDR